MKVSMAVIVVVLVILFFAHMRFACTGIWSKVLAMSLNKDTGHKYETIKCQYVGWKDFHFQLWKKWFDSNSLY